MIGDMFCHGNGFLGQFVMKEYLKLTTRKGALSVQAGI